MPDYLVDRKITQGEADELMSEMELDLTAIFKVMEQDIIETIESWEGSPDELVDEIISKLDPQQVVINGVQKSEKQKAFALLGELIDTISKGL